MSNPEELNRSRDSDPILAGSIELRIGEIGNDAEELTRLFAQPSTLPHLSGITPRRLSENEKYYYDNRQNKYPLNTSIMTTEPDEIRDYYESNKASLVPIMAYDPNNKGKLLGSVTVIKPSGGLLFAVVSKLVVDEQARRKNLGTSLVRAANKYIFDNEYWQSYAGIIVGVPGDAGPRRIFGREGFVSREPIEPNRCISWDTETESLRIREVELVVLQKDAYRKSQER